MIYYIFVRKINVKKQKHKNVTKFIYVFIVEIIVEECNKEIVDNIIFVTMENNVGMLNVSIFIWIQMKSWMKFIFFKIYEKSD